MDDKTLAALTTLALKLGTTAEYLWGVLLRQAPLAAVQQALAALLWLAVTVAIFTVAAKVKDDFVLGLTLIFGMLAALVTLVCGYYAVERRV